MAESTIILTPRGRTSAATSFMRCALPTEVPPNFSTFKVAYMFICVDCGLVYN